MLRGNFLIVGALLLVWSGVANAGDSATKGVAQTSGPVQNSNDLAATAYDRGAAAFDAKDYPRAAEEFSHADALAPNTLALQLALDSAMRAGRPAMVMDLATRAEARLTSPNAFTTASDRVALTALIARAHAEYEDRTGMLTIQCAAPRVCSARVDDRPWTINSRGWIAVGRHVVSMKVDGREDRRDIVIPPRERIEVRPEPPPAPQAVIAQPAQTGVQPSRPLAPPKGTASAAGGTPPLQGENKHSRRSMSPTWFWVGATTTAVLGGLAIASGVDTYAKHNEFELNRTADRASDGREAQTRTNVLLGLTAIGVVATATLAVFFVDWSHRGTPGRASTSRTTLGLGSCFTLTTTY